MSDCMADDIAEVLALMLAGPLWTTRPAGHGFAWCRSASLGSPRVTSPFGYRVFFP